MRTIDELLEDWAKEREEQLRKREEEERINPSCKHPSLPQPVFDEEDALRINDTYEIRKKYPRLVAHCPDCDATVILYASWAHYIMGDY